MPLKTTVDETPTLNLTSMIDVLFLLVMFFMAGTRFAEMEHKINVQVPRVKDAQGASDASAARTIVIAKDGTLLFDQRPVELAELPRILREAKRQSPDLAVSVRGDHQAILQHLAEVLVACQEVKLLAVDIPVKRADTRRQ